MSRWGPALAVLVAVGGTARAQVLDENELVAMLRSAYRTCSGVAWSTKEKTIREFMQGADLHSVDVVSAVVRPGFLDGYVCTSIPEEGYYLGICSTAGELSHASKIPFWDLDPRGPSYRREIIAGRIGSPRIARFEAVKQYGDLSVRYYLYVPDWMSLEDLREGREVSFRFILTGALHFYLDHKFSQRFYGVAQRIMPETPMLRCAEGHEYPPTTERKFCPKDGLPLR
jgi:hypothetical protein